MQKEEILTTPDQMPEKLGELLSFYREEYENTRRDSEKTKQRRAAGYISDLVELTRFFSGYVKSNPEQAESVLRCASLIIQEGYPPYYINPSYDRAPFDNSYNDANTFNSECEINLSSSLRTLLRNVAEANPAYMQEACDIAATIQDCNEDIFSGAKSVNAVFENRQKRNFISWMKRKMAERASGKETDEEKPLLYIGESRTIATGTQVEYQDGVLKSTIRSEVVANKAVLYAQDIYLSREERDLIEKIIETKDKAMMGEIVRAVDGGFTEKKVADLHTKYVKFRTNKKEAKSEQIAEEQEKPAVSRSNEGSIIKLIRNIRDKIKGKG